MSLHGRYSARPLQRRTRTLKRMRDQNFRFCSRSIPQLRCVCKFFLAYLKQSWAPHVLNTARHSGNLWSLISLKSCFSHCFEEFLRFFGRRKSQYCSWGSVQRAWSEFQANELYFTACSSSIWERLFFWPRLKQNVRAAHSGWQGNLGSKSLTISCVGHGK